jgi:hypothetical protein
MADAHIQKRSWPAAIPARARIAAAHPILPRHRAQPKGSVRPFAYLAARTTRIASSVMACLQPRQAAAKAGEAARIRPAPSAPRAPKSIARRDTGQALSFDQSRAHTHCVIARRVGSRQHCAFARANSALRCAATAQRRTPHRSTSR